MNKSIILTLEVVWDFVIFRRPFWLAPQVSKRKQKTKSLQWRHNEGDGVSSHRRLHCLLNCGFRRRSKKNSKLRVTGLCAGNSPVTGEFPAQKASNAENVSIWWRHHVLKKMEKHKSHTHHDICSYCNEKIRVRNYGCMGLGYSILWVVFIHPYPNFNGAAAKLNWKLWHE